MFRPKRGSIVLVDAPIAREPQAALIARLAEIQAMTAGQLRAEFERLAGRPTGSWNRTWLVRKVSWLTQAAARQAYDAVDGPTLVPEVRDQPRSPVLNAPIMAIPGRGVRDPRLPRPGTQVVKMYRGLKLLVDVVEGAFLWNGRPYRSLTAIAKDVTGQPFINGRLFFNLTPRRRGKGRTERNHG